MILMIDNYDSFTYNLCQYIGEMNPEIEVYRNNKITIEEIRKKAPSHIIISPGPGFPREAGICIETIRTFGGSIPILGVCLGHQAIGEAYGSRIMHADRLKHGKTSEIAVSKSCEIFSSMEERITVGRYHSLVIEKESLSEDLCITAVTDAGEIMGVQHRYYPVFGIQFHPESILTPSGKQILSNFLSIRSAKGGRVIC